MRGKTTDFVSKYKSDKGTVKSVEPVTLSARPFSGGPSFLFYFVAKERLV